jgi:hypothetical protein
MLRGRLQNASWQVTKCFVAEVPPGLIPTLRNRNYKGGRALVLPFIIVLY